MQMLAAVHIMCLDDQRLAVWKRTDSEKKMGLVQSLKPRSILANNLNACVIALGCIEARMETYPTDLTHDLLLLKELKGEEAVSQFAALHQMQGQLPTVVESSAGGKGGANRRPELVPALLVRLGEKAILARAHAMLVKDIAALRRGHAGAVAGGAPEAELLAQASAGVVGQADPSAKVSIFSFLVQEKERERQAEAARIAASADGEDWLPTNLQKKKGNGDSDMAEAGEEESKKKGKKKKKKRKK
jgi:hypothetical protein